MKHLSKTKIIILDILFIFILFSIKLTLFNDLIDNKIDSRLFLSVGFIYMLFFIIISRFFKGKYKNIVFLFTYISISFIMFVDTIYFKQFNRLPSSIIVSQFSQISNVSKSIFYLINFKNLLLILDIIPLTIYFSIVRKKLTSPLVNKNSISWNIKRTLFQIGLVFIFILASIFTIVKWGSSSLSQEFFSYHIQDIYEVLSTSVNEEKLDLTVFDAESNKSNEDKELFGVGKDKNIITIQVEALQNFVINNSYEGQEITPNLNKLISKDSIYFDNYYQQIGMGNTSDAEFVSHNSLYPAMDGQTYSKYEKNTFYGLPWILKDNNYSTTAFHGYDGSFWNRENAYPNQGFDNFISEKDYDLKETIGLGLSDEEFFKQTVSKLKNLDSPYYAFLITLTSHHPYDMPSEYHSIKLKEQHKDTLLGNYIESINYLDKQLGVFIEDLKKEGLYENTVINIYGDHLAIPSNIDENKKLMSEYLDKDYDYDEMMNIPLIVHIPNSGLQKVNHISGGQIDFLPTVLNILGLENKKGLMFGRDLNNSQKGFVAQQTYMLKGSFINNENIFIMSREGVFEKSEAFNINTRKPIDISNCKKEYDKAIKSINTSDYILKNDSLREYINGNKDISIDEKSEPDKLSPAKYISHAGGRVRDLSYTNSKEALDKSYENGYKLIEIDMEWTTDENLVLIHDWDGYVEEAFGVEPKMYSTEEFKSFNMISNLTQMSIDDLAKWLKNHPDVYVVTDIKTDNVKALTLISDRYPDLIDRFIPQIYKFDEYINTSLCGYQNIILTLYLSDYTDKEILDFVNRYNLMAVTMPIDRAKTTLPEKLNDLNIFVYAHTINDEKLEKELLSFYVNGIYTDDLLPD